MDVEVRLFAMLRERAGRESVTIELLEGATVRDAIDAVSRQCGLGEMISRMPVVMAVNRDYAPEELCLSDGDELALIPPVSGGSVAGAEAGGRIHACVTAESLSIERLVGLVSRPGAGAVVTFQGTTRNVDRLDYEAYNEMAEERIEVILGEAVTRHGLEAAAAEHRVGAVPLGESSVAVAVSAAHRGQAFAGAREVIDRIKSEAPIWKREVDGDDRRWVEGRRPGDDG